MTDQPTPGQPAKINLTDEKSAMRALASELDKAMSTIVLLAIELPNVPQYDPKFKSAMADVKRAYSVLEQVNEFLRTTEKYTIKKNEGWGLEKTTKQLADQLGIGDRFATIRQISGEGLNLN